MNVGAVIWSSLTTQGETMMHGECGCSFGHVAGCFNSPVPNENDKKRYLVTVTVEVTAWDDEEAKDIVVGEISPRFALPIVVDQTEEIEDDTPVDDRESEYDTIEERDEARGYTDDDHNMERVDGYE